MFIPSLSLSLLLKIFCFWVVGRNKDNFHWQQIEDNSNYNNNNNNNNNNNDSNNSTFIFSRHIHIHLHLHLSSPLSLSLHLSYTFCASFVCAALSFVIFTFFCS
ncbi:uncharacterized protein Dmoj_GI26636 [Drosophila mojavensis]|uniref:Uncharacterized protein n=1 Tax=Drosophila mojavensis TaxID=7230 RepID=A0A0Q9XL12_DROMO|nr:uncharacterized protein Dmoj_GI26636 [Drosophila mojavensis]